MLTIGEKRPVDLQPGPLSDNEGFPQLIWGIFPEMMNT